MERNPWETFFLDILKENEENTQNNTKKRELL